MGCELPAGCTSARPEPRERLDGSISLHPELRTRPTQPEMSGVGRRRTDAPEEASARPPRAEARHAFLRGRLAGDEAEVLGRRGAAGDGCRQARARSRRRAGEPGEIARHFGKANGLKSALASPSRHWRGLGGFPRRQEGFAARRGKGSPGFARQRCIKER